MTYAVKEIFYTLQGEGMRVGRPAVFCRFAGCNLWSGREQDRADAQCSFCDTDFVGTDGKNGGRYDAEALADRVAKIWAGGDQGQSLPFRGGVGVGLVGGQAGERQPPPPSPPLKGRGERPRPLVVITGGEPMLQLDAALIDALHACGFEIAVESNGTLPAPAGLDWICVS